MMLGYCRNDIKHAGLVGGHGSKVTAPGGAFEPWGDDGSGDDLFYCAKLKSTKWHELFLYENGAPKDPLFYRRTRNIFAAEWAEAESIDQGGETPTRDLREHFPVLPYRGAMYECDADHKQIVCNEGHLRTLDHPSSVDVLEGMQVYHQPPRQVSVKQSAC